MKSRHQELSSSNRVLAQSRRRDPLPAAPARSELPDPIRRDASAPAAAPTPAARRQRRHRTRRKQGRFVVSVEVTCEMITALVDQGDATSRHAAARN